MDAWPQHRAALILDKAETLVMRPSLFARKPVQPRPRSPKYACKKPALERSKDSVFRNSFADIEYVLETCSGNDTRFEFECYDIGHLYNLKYFLDKGLVKPPLFVQSCFGILGGIGTHPKDIIMMKRTADRLFGDQYRWSVLGAGASQMRVATNAITRGGNARVGLEDSLWAGKGKLAVSNAEQVRLLRGIIESNFGST